MSKINTIDNPEIREIIASYNILLEYFEQIKAYNQIGYQTIHLGLFNAISNLKQDSYDAVIENFNKAIEKSKTASSKIEQLSASGTKLLKSLKEK